MKGRFRIVAALGLGLALAASGYVKAEELGLWDCVARAVRFNPQAAVGQWRVTMADRTVDESETLFRPDLKLNAQYSVNTYIPEIPLPGRAIKLGDHDDTGVTVQADYLLYDWGRRRNNLEADRRQLASAGLSLGAMRQNLAYHAGSAFLALQGAKNEQRVAENSVQISETHLEDLKARFDNGVITWDEVLNGEVRLDRARVRLSRAANSVRLTRIELLETMGLGLESDAAFADTALDVPEPQSEPTALLKVLADRPDVEQYGLRAAALELRTAALEAGNKPTLQAFVSGTAAKPGIDQFRNELIEYARAGVSFNWPIWDWKRSEYRKAQVEAEREAVLSEQLVLAGKIALELERARFQVQEAGERLDLTARTLEAAREHFRLLGERYDQGRASNTEYLDAEEQLTESGLDHAYALIDLETSRWQLAYVSGSLYREVCERWPELASGRTDMDNNNK